MRIFDLPPGKVRTVYFGPARHFRRITDPLVLRAVRQKYRLPERFIFTLSKGGGGERKNIRGVFEAFSRLHGKVPHKLVVGGKGLEGFRREYGIPDTGWGRDVLFPGYLDQADLPAIYSASDLYLYPSNQETRRSKRGLAVPPQDQTAAYQRTPPVVRLHHGRNRPGSRTERYLLQHSRPEQTVHDALQVSHASLTSAASCGTSLKSGPFDVESRSSPSTHASNTLNASRTVGAPKAG